MEMENNLPKGWTEVAIKELELNFFKGVNVGYKGADGEYMFIPSGANFPSGIKLDKVKWISEDELSKIPQEKILQDGDILFNSGGVGTLGRSSYFDNHEGATVCDSFIIVIRDYLKQTNMKYLFYWFQSAKADELIKANTKGTTGITSIKSSDLENFEIPLPPLAEQHRIVAKLDAIIQKIESNKQRLEKIPKILKRFRQSVLAAAVSGKLTEEWREKNGIVEEWKEVELSSVLPKGGIFDGPFGSNLKTDDYTNNGVRVIRLENIEHLRFIHEKETFVTEEKYQSLIRHSVGEGDIIFSSFISEEIRACILPKLSTKAIAKADCFCIRPDETQIDKIYLLYTLISIRAYEQLVMNIHGATRPRINTTQLKTLQILLPCLKEQNEIVRRVEQLFAFADKIETRYTKAKAMLDKLPQSILAKAFRGELVAQDPNDEPASVLLDRIKAEKEKLAAKKKGKKTKEYSIEETPVKIAAEKKVRYKEAK